MDSNNVKTTVKVENSEVVGAPRAATTVTKTDDGAAIVEIKTTFIVDDPEKVFSLQGAGITMSFESQN